VSAFGDFDEKNQKFAVHRVLPADARVVLASHSCL
jgi:hypothetical protein